MSDPWARHPRQRQLPGRASLLTGQFHKCLDQGEVGLARLAHEPRVAGRPEVAVVERRRGQRPGEHAPTQRAVGDQPDADLPQDREDLGLEVPGEQRVLALQRRDRVHGVGPADRGSTGLRQPEVADLARLDEVLHRADGLLDRHVRVDPVLEVQVDVVDAEPLQRGVAGAADVLGRAVDAHPRAVRVPLVAELRGQLHLVTATGDGLADEQLVGEGPVHVGGVEERHPQVERTVDGPRWPRPRPRPRRTRSCPCSRGRRRRRRGRQFHCRGCVAES